MKIGSWQLPELLFPDLVDNIQGQPIILSNRVKHKSQTKPTMRNKRQIPGKVTNSILQPFPAVWTKEPDNFLLINKNENKIRDFFFIVLSVFLLRVFLSDIPTSNVRAKEPFARPFDWIFLSYVSLVFCCVVAIIRFLFV